MTDYDELRTAPLWDNPAFQADTGPTVRFWSNCGDCGKWLTDGDLCGHCERKHVRRVVERYGTDSAGVCGSCATEAGLTAARAGGDVGHLYDDTLRRKAGLPVTCEPDKADQLDVELCDEPVRPALPWSWPALPEAFGVNEADLELTDMEPLTSALQRDIEASMLRHPAGSRIGDSRRVLEDQSEWAVLPMPAGPPVIGPEDSLADMGLAAMRWLPGDDDDVLGTIRAARATIGYLMRNTTRGPASYVILAALDKRLQQLEAAEVAKGADHA